MSDKQNEPMKLWYLAASDASKAAIRLLGLRVEGNYGGWVHLFAGDNEVWHGHGYEAAWPFLAEQYGEQLSPIPLTGQSFIRSYQCSECGYWRHVTPVETPPPVGSCQCGHGPIPLCGSCHRKPALPGRLVCGDCADSPRMMEYWGAREREWQEWHQRFGKPLADAESPRSAP